MQKITFLGVTVATANQDRIPSQAEDMGDVKIADYQGIVFINRFLTNKMFDLFRFLHILGKPLKLNLGPYCSPPFAVGSVAAAT